MSWPQHVARLVAAAGEGSEALADAGARSARALVAADAAALIRWQDGRAVLLASDGDPALGLHERLAEGAGSVGGRPFAAVSVDPRTDLVVTRTGRGKRFIDADLDTLRAWGALVAWASGRRQSRSPLGRLATRVVASLHTDDVLLSTVDAVSRLLQAEIAGVLLLDEAGEELEMQCTVGNSEPDTAKLRVRPGQGLAGRVAQSGRPERIDDYSTDERSAPEFFALSDKEGTCSAIAAPLWSGGRVTGALCAWRRRRAPFTNEDEGTLEAIAELCGAGLDNAGLYEAEQRQRRDSEAARRTADEEARSAEAGLAVQAELTRVAMEGRDVASVVRTVSRLCHCVALVRTDDGRVIGSSSVAATERLAGRLEASLRTALPFGEGQEQVALGQPDGTWLSVTRVRAAGVTYGHLALGLERPPSREETLAAEQAAVTCALMLGREEAAVEASRRLQSEFAWDLLEGRLPDAVEAAVRARHLGAGFALPARVVAIELDGLSEEATAAGWNLEHLERARGACSSLISRELAEAGAGGAVLARRADRFALVVPSPALPPGDQHRNGSGPRRLARALAGITWPRGVRAAVGVSAPVERMDGFPEAWREARLALSAAPRDGQPGLFEDLGVLQFFLAPTSRSELDAFAKRLLGPLLAYDRDHGSELFHTLEVFLSTGCSTRRTAELINVHHRTVSYRVQRISEITGLHLDDMDDMLHVRIACKILKLGDEEPA